MARKEGRARNILTIIGQLKGVLLFAALALYLIPNLVIQILTQILTVSQLSQEHLSLVRWLFNVTAFCLTLLAVVALGIKGFELWLEHRGTFTLQETHILTLHLKKTDVASIARQLGKNVRTVRSELTSALRKFPRYDI